MTTAADDTADEAAFEAFLAGRPVPVDSDGGASAVGAFAGAVRATTTVPGRPSAALAELLATGLLTDQSTPSTRTARSAGSPPRRPVRRRRSAVFFPALLAKFLSAGAVAQAASGAGIALVAFTGAGATGLLGDDVQTTIASAVGAEDTTDVVTPGATTPDAPTPDDETAGTGQPLDPAEVPAPAVEVPVPTEVEFDAEAWLEGPADAKSFGEWVSKGAHNKDALEAAAAIQGTDGFRFGQLVSKWATQKHMSAEDLAAEGVDLDGLTEGDGESAPLLQSATGDAGTQAATTERGHSDAGNDRGNSNDDSNRGNNGGGNGDHGNGDHGNGGRGRN